LATLRMYVSPRLRQGVASRRATPIGAGADPPAEPRAGKKIVGWMIHPPYTVEKVQFPQAFVIVSVSTSRRCAFRRSDIAGQI
jgi:hypothetical protein